MPAWRSEPPTRCFQRHASSMNSAEPQSTAPRGAPRPLVKSSQTESAPAVISFAVMPAATTAFISRAPSMCVAMPLSCAIWNTADRRSSGQSVPPPRLAVCSTSRRVCGGELRRFSRSEAFSVSASNWPPCPFRPSDGDAGERGRCAALCGDDMRGFMRNDFVAGTAMRQDGDLVAHGAGGQEHRCLLAEQRGHAVAERMHGGVIAVLLIPHFGLDHGLLHRRGGPGLRVRIKVHLHRGQQRIRAHGGIGHTVLLEPRDG